MTSDVCLSALCDYAEGRISVDKLDSDNYISTENMLQNKEGICKSSGLPTVAQTQAYQPEDVLVSNIRPYFRKIWFADRESGCSNDVLVLRAKETCYPHFLYYVLSDNDFFDYATATGKGTKMPRGDKGAIMRYSVPDLSYDTQVEIADTLTALDARIAENKKINHHLAEMSATDSSPDIRRGKRVSRVRARVSFSRPFANTVSMNVSTVFANRPAISTGGMIIDSVFKTPVISRFLMPVVPFS